jgi:hypothetical protein
VVRRAQGDRSRLRERHLTVLLLILRPLANLAADLRVGRSAWPDGWISRPHRRELPGQGSIAPHRLQ